MTFTHIFRTGATGLIGGALAGGTLLVAALMAEGAPMDIDGDGVVTLEELQASMPETTEALFATMDADDSGGLDATELAHAVEMGLLPDDA